MCHTYPVAFLLTVGVRTRTLTTSYMTKPLVHPPRGATVAVMVVGGVVRLLDWVVIRQCQSTTTITPPSPSLQPPPSHHHHLATSTTTSTHVTNHHAHTHKHLIKKILLITETTIFKHII